MSNLSFKGWLATNKITQREIARVLGISCQAVNKKVNGKEDFSMSQARILCKTYNIDANIFVD